MSVRGTNITAWASKKNRADAWGRRCKRLLSYGGGLLFPCRLVAIMIVLVVIASCLTYKHFSSILLMEETQWKHQHDMTYPGSKRQHLTPASNHNNRRMYNIYSGLIQESSAGSTGVDNGEKHKQRQLRLRYDWTNLSPGLDLTKTILQHQSNCSIPTSTFTYRNRFGLGSDLHIYTKALGNGIEANRRIRTVGNWIWMDQTKCGNDLHGTNGNEKYENRNIPLGSPMRCYFATSELNCPGDVEYAVANPEFDPEHSLSKPNGNVLVPHDDYVSNMLPSKNNSGEQKLQTAVVESLFIRTTPLVVQEAERQLNLVFGGKDKVPKDLITVHIRWGDKVATYEGKKRKRLPEMYVNRHYNIWFE
uniref:Uncharacterized protein n=1 Tax=Pseudo-nitzschia australis TaxID=44445 RepID=A0A7S4AJ31_9STRA